MIGAGGQAGQGDAANLLKPALARGELRTIAATTWAEYKKYFEKDAALARRFQVVKVEEPTEDGRHRHDARPGRQPLEKHHKVRDPRRGRGRRRAALAPLHLRPPAARQVGQPAGHRLRPRGHRPGGDARPRSRTASGGSTTATPRSTSSTREEATGADHQERLGRARSNEDAAEAELAGAGRHVGGGARAGRQDPRAADEAGGAGRPEAAGARREVRGTRARRRRPPRPPRRPRPPPQDRRSTPEAELRRAQRRARDAPGRERR